MFPPGASSDHPPQAPPAPRSVGPERARPPWRGGVEEHLPPGYRLRADADLLVLLGPGGSEVAAFSAQGADPLEVVAEAWEDYG
jgi:hypothetical protein